ncbi:hypothetical protein FPV67DRAFT_1629323 [Lyophyllum atratum]|nr:hypothetical protein FPV67DRAFT_1629323 [Lyophyllum atratum]
MQFTMLRALATLFLVSVFALTHAAPSSLLSSRDVYVPPVTYPHTGTVWKVRQRQNVTWDTSNAPVNITNQIGLIFLRKGNITAPLILAENFEIRLGRVEVTVPLVPEGNDYFVVLLGESGSLSLSQTFTITS